MTTTPDSASINPLDVVRMLRSAGGALFTQAALHGELARVGWVDEKARWLTILRAALLGFASLMCCMLMSGALVLAYSWDTTFRVPAAIALLVAYGLATGLAWGRFNAASAKGSQAFAATREELAADLALLKSNL
jgi:uncharacterized membrane protein YqjE